MAIHKLNDLKISAKIREAQDRSYSPNAKNMLIGDGEGLYLAISKTGTSSWLYRYMSDAKAKTVGLGGYPVVPLKQAREKAQELREARTDGIDPVQAKKANAREDKLKQAKSKTFQTCADLFIEHSRASWKNEKHLQQWQNSLSRYVFPIIGKNAIGNIHTDEIVRILAPIWQSKHETATRLRARMESIIAWATVHGWRTGENPARLKGNMEFLLPKVRVTGKKHHASLPFEQLPTFMKDLQVQNGMSRYALEFLILCASRTEEVVSLTWDEFDLTKSIWTIPATRMKAGVSHRVPLGKRALQILKVIRPFSGEKYVFKTGNKDVPMSTGAMAMLLRRMNVTDVTVHGMRSTFRNWAGEKTSYPFEVCEQALAHRLPDAVAAAYLRSDFFEKRVNLLLDWETFARSDCK